jgi:hypothetical protein
MLKLGTRLTEGNFAAALADASISEVRAAQVSHSLGGRRYVSSLRGKDGGRSQNCRDGQSGLRRIKLTKNPGHSTGALLSSLLH